MPSQGEDSAVDPPDDAEEDLLTSSPLKRIIPSVSGHNRQEVAGSVYHHFAYEVDNATMWELLKLSDEKSKLEKVFGKPPSFVNRVSKMSMPLPTKYCIYLNEISQMVRKRIRKLKVPYIKFVDTPYRPPKDHPTGTMNEPDLIALKFQEEDHEIPEDVFWSAVETTGEIKSAGDTVVGAFTKARSYVGYLLQARPDRTTALGIYTEEKGFKLILHNCFGSFGTKLLVWGNQPNILLLCAWVWCLYHPITMTVDPTITRTVVWPTKGAATYDPPTFDVKTPGEVFPGCSVLTAGAHFGRRTIVLNTQTPGTVIKEQYVDPGRRYEEGQILHKIHREGDFPGVVRVGWYGPVKDIIVKNNKSVKVEATPEHSMHEDVSEKVKMRLILKDTAFPLLDAETPLDVLIAIYDLLEVTRFLYAKYQILHRDISDGNVCLRKELVNDDDSFNKTLGDMCLASHMIQQQLGLSGVGRLATKLLLIDFDVSEDQGQKAGKRRPKPRTGAPLFMAGLLRTKQRKTGTYILPGMPELHGDAATAYKKCVLSRLDEFPQVKEELVKNTEKKMLDEHRHKLRYDAESAFWLLLYWVVLACPAEKKIDDYPIPETFWRNLTDSKDGEDYRSSCLERLANKAIVSDYDSLECLIKLMADHLVGDYDASQDQYRKHDAFLHEAFQRIILNFLFENYSAPFMTLKKGLINRKVEKKEAMRPPLSRASVDANRNSRSRSRSQSMSSTGTRRTQSELGAPLEMDIDTNIRGRARATGKHARDKEGDDLHDGNYKPSISTGHTLAIMLTKSTLCSQKRRRCGG